MASAHSISAALPAVAPPAPRGVQWIDVATAADRSGLTPRAITEQCGKKWFAAGLARLDGSRWMIREDADPRIGRVSNDQDAAKDLKGLTTRQRSKTLWKRAVVAEWRGFNNSDACRGMTVDQVEAAFSQLLAAGQLAIKLLPGVNRPPSAKSIRRWSEGVGLVDGRSTRYQDEGPSADDPFFEFVKILYLDQRRRKVSECWRFACFEASRQQWMIRSYPQTKRFVQAIPEPVKVLFRGGNKAYNDKCSPYIERDYTTLAVNQIWNADHHEFDVWTNHQGKPVRAWLTAFQDVRSRKIVGWKISADGGNTDTILAAMTAAMDDAGVPGSIYMDWGRDFTSKAIGGVTRKVRMAAMVRQPVDQDARAAAAMLGLKPIDDLPPALESCFGKLSICGALGVNVIHCMPYHGQSKPIERLFGTMQQFTRMQSSYCGNSPANRPENLAGKFERGTMPELDDFIADFGLWVNWYNESHAHHGDGMDGQSPAVVFDLLRTEKRVIPDDVRIILGWKPSPLVKIGRNGARCSGTTYALPPHEAIRWHGKAVSVRVDPANVNRAAICTPDGRFVCIANAVEKMPWDATAEQKAKANAAVKSRKKLVRKYHEERPRLDRSVTEEMWHQQAEESRRRRETAASPVPFVTVSTPMNDQLGKIGRELGASQRPQLPGPALADVFPASNAGDLPALPSRFIYESKPEPEEPRLPSIREFSQAFEQKIDAEAAEKAACEDPWKLAMEVFGTVHDEPEVEP